MLTSVVVLLVFVVNWYDWALVATVTVPAPDPYTIWNPSLFPVQVMSTRIVHGPVPVIELIATDAHAFGAAPPGFAIATNPFPPGVVVCGAVQPAGTRTETC